MYKENWPKTAMLLLHVSINITNSWYQYLLVPFVGSIWWDKSIGAWLIPTRLRLKTCDKKLTTFGGGCFLLCLLWYVLYLVQMTIAHAGHDMFVLNHGELWIKSLKAKKLLFHFQLLHWLSTLFTSTWKMRSDHVSAVIHRWWNCSLQQASRKEATMYFLHTDGWSWFDIAAALVVFYWNAKPASPIITDSTNAKNKIKRKTVIFF